MLKPINLSEVKQSFQNHNKILLYGAGKNLHKIIDWMIFEKIASKSITVIDSDIKKQNSVISTELGKFTIKSPDSLKDMAIDNTLVIITPNAYHDIANSFADICSADILCYSDIYALFEKESDQFDISNKKIVVYSTEPYAGHEKYIIKKLLEIRNDLDIVVVSDCGKNKISNDFRYVDLSKTFHSLHELKTAHVIIDNWTYGPSLKKNKDQIIIEVKHWSSITLKSFGYDVYKTHNKTESMKKTEEFGKMIDYIVCGSEIDRKSVSSGFCYSGKFLNFGSPRSDILFSDNTLKQDFCISHGIDDNCHFILYAPTFRYTESDYTTRPQAVIEMDCDLIRKCFSNRFGGEWYILLRLHHLVAEMASEYSNHDKMIDVSHYPDSQELAAISDVMITDYSSFMFEPAYVRKPVFLLAPDKDDYLKKERSFILDYDFLPFPIAKDNFELSELINSFNADVYQKNVNEFFKKHGVHEDGHASERTASFISDIIDGKVE